MTSLFLGDGFYTSVFGPLLDVFGDVFKDSVLKRLPIILHLRTDYFMVTKKTVKI